MTAVPDCAHGCPFVAMAIRELARAHGLTEQAERSNHALRPAPDKAGTLFALTQGTGLVPVEVAES